MKDVLYFILQELFVLFADFSVYFYNSFQNVNVLLYIFTSLSTIALFVILLVNKNNKYISIFPISIILLFLIFSLSIFIGYQLNDLDKIGHKIVDNIKVKRTSGYSIPLNLEDLDTIDFTNTEIKKIKQNFIYSYYNKDSVKVKFNIMVDNDYYDLSYKFTFLRFNINYNYNFKNNKFYIWD